MKTWMLAALSLALSQNSIAQSSLSGAWQSSAGDNEIVFVIIDDYVSFSSYDRDAKKFNFTWGGVVKQDNNKLTINTEFNSHDPDEVGRIKNYEFQLRDGKLLLSSDGKEDTYTRIDEGKGDLAGTWRISARMQGDKMNPITPGPRKTLKILSGTRFQWVAINTETKEFFGTGGGTCTFKDGKYTETIEFFSRDNSRVGASLSFDGKVKNGVWTHSGLNSRGEPLMEEWTRIN